MDIQVWSINKRWYISRVLSHRTQFFLLKNLEKHGFPIPAPSSRGANEKPEGMLNWHPVMEPCKAPKLEGPATHEYMYINSTTKHGFVFSSPRFVSCLVEDCSEPLL